MAQAVMDIGPAAPQLNIPIAGEYINDIILTHLGIPGPILLIGKCPIQGGALAEIVSLRIYRNGVEVPGSWSQFGIAVANSRVTLTAFAAIPDSTTGDVYRLFVTASASAADIATDNATLTMLGVPAQHSLAPQAVPTP